MSKKWMVIAGVAALVVVALVAGLLLMSRKPSTSTTSNTGGASGGASTTTSTTASGNTTNTASSTTLGGTTGGTSGGTSGGTTGGTSGGTSGGGSGGISGGGSSNPALDPLKPFPPLPDVTAAAKTLTDPEAPGETLAPLKAAPASTISGLEIGAVPDGAQYKITLRPYGVGPSIFYGSRLVVRIDSIKPVGSAPANSKLANANALVLVDTTHGGTITKGGTYTATITFRSDGAKMLPILSLASASQ